MRTNVNRLFFEQNSTLARITHINFICGLLTEHARLLYLMCFRNIFVSEVALRRRILVTGGAGYVGRVLTRQLYRDHDVCVLDKLSFGIERFSQDERKFFRLERADICDAQSVRQIVDDFAPEFVIHLAALHFIPLCENQPGAALAVNVVGTANLLAACPPGCRFVFASSGAVYEPSDLPHDEMASATGPRDVYGYTKLHGESYVRYFASERNLAAVIVRLFNVVGPGETNPHLLPEIVAQMKAGQTQIRLGNTWPKRDYIHVEDAASGFAAAALEGNVEPGETVTVNLATSQQHSVSDIMALLSTVSGISVAVLRDPARERRVDRPMLGATINEMNRRFGWTPRLTIHDAVHDLWRDPDLTPELATKYLQLPAAAKVA